MEMNLHCVRQCYVEPKRNGMMNQPENIFKIQNKLESNNEMEKQEMKYKLGGFTIDSTNVYYFFSYLLNKSQRGI